MEAQDKELLLKDLSARLPYGVQAEGLYEEYDDNDKIIQIKTCGFITCITCSIVTIGINDNCKLGTVKPYLRPMSSMTEEEKIEFSNIFSKWFNDELFILSEEPFLEDALHQINYSISHELFDWLDAHHFDYRGLIEMGLALEASEGMYNF